MNIIHFALSLIHACRLMRIAEIPSIAASCPLAARPQLPHSIVICAVPEESSGHIPIRRTSHEFDNPELLPDFQIWKLEKQRRLIRRGAGATHANRDYSRWRS